MEAYEATQQRVVSSVRRGAVLQGLNGLKAAREVVKSLFDQIGAWQVLRDHMKEFTSGHPLRNRKAFTLGSGGEPLVEGDQLPNRR